MSSLPNKTRHVSIRVPDALFDELETVATMNDETVSQCARRLLGEGLAPRRPAAALDDAIASLQRMRRRLDDGMSSAGRAPTESEPAPPVVPPPAVAPRTVNVLNAKANLSRLLADVARGDEIIIAHAGSTRARLVPVAD